MAEAREAKESARGRRQHKVGVVVSDKMEQTVVVAVARLVAHPRYGKRQRTTTKFLAHDAGNHCTIGDRVTIVESRPLSKRKRWRVAKILEQGEKLIPAGSAAGSKGGA